MPQTAKTCFVIGPIGEPLTDAYNRALRMLERVITPAVAPLGYIVARADQIGTSGFLHVQIAAQLLQADLVVADLTGANPNVYYELGIRHTLGKACIQLLPVGERLPFDVEPMRTIIIDDRTQDGVQAGVAALQTQILAATTPLITPVSVLVSVTTSVRDTALFAAASTIGSAPPTDRPVSAPSRAEPQPPVSPVEVEELGIFWESLDELDRTGAPAQIGQVVSEMVAQIMSHPRRAVADANGVRVIESQEATIDGVTLPGFRLAYYLDERPRPSGAAGAVLLLHVAAGDDPLAEGGRAAEI